MAAGDAAASAHLHPLAEAAQVGHILRGPSHCELALELGGAQPLPADAVAVVLEKATPALLEVLWRCPHAAARNRALTDVMSCVYACLRLMASR